MRRKTLWVVLVVILALALFRGVFLVKVPCGHVGVRWSQFGGTGADGPRTRLLLPGLRLKLPVYHRMELLSTRARKADIEHIEITLKDNLKVYVDATVLFRIDVSELALRFAKDRGEQYIERALPNDLTRVVREALEDTDADGFLEVSWRTAQVTAIEKSLKELLEPRGINLSHFFLRDFAFAASYEQELKRQRLSRQRMEIGALQTRLSTLEAEGDVEVRALRAEIDEVNRSVERQIQAIEHESKLVAEDTRLKGEFQLAQAELEGQRMMNEALGSADAEAMLKAELVETIRQGLRFVVLKSSDLGVFDSLNERGQQR